MSKDLGFARKFVILKPEFSNMKGLNPKGHGRLVLRGNKLNISLNIENGEKNNYYNVILLTGRDVYDLGKIFTEEDYSGRADFNLNYKELREEGFSIERINGVLIVRGSKILIGGYFNKNDNTVENYIKSFKITEREEPKERKLEEKKKEEEKKEKKKKEEEKIIEPERNIEVEKKKSEIKKPKETKIDSESDKFKEVEKTEEIKLDDTKKVKAKEPEDLKKPETEEIKRKENEEIKVKPELEERGISKNKKEKKEKKDKENKEDTIETKIIGDIGDEEDIKDKEDIEDEENIIEVEIVEEKIIDENKNQDYVDDKTEKQSKEDKEEIKEVPITADITTEKEYDKIMSNIFDKDKEKEENERCKDKKTKQRIKTTEYILNILSFFPYAEPFKIDLQGYNWWKIDVNDIREEVFLPYFSYVIGGHHKYPIIEDSTTANNLIEKYKHYIFGLYNINNEVKFYVYGVPGYFSKEDHPQKGNTGFNTWFEGRDDYGYWLLYIDPTNGRIIHPVNSMIPTK